MVRNRKVGTLVKAAADLITTRAILNPHGAVLPGKIVKTGTVGIIVNEQETEERDCLVWFEGCYTAVGVYADEINPPY